MIDFIKIVLPQHYKKAFLSHDDLEFKGKVNLKTGEVSDQVLECEYKALTLKVFPGGVEIKGSLHKFYNEEKGNGRQNHSMFTEEQVKEAVEILCEKFDFDAASARVVNLEFGLNIETTFNPTDFLKESLISYKYGEPTRIGFGGSYYEFKKSKYYLKVYDKGKQYSCKDNKLRVELKYITHSQINRLGISHLSDIPIKLGNCAAELLKVFDNLITTDTLVIKGIKRIVSHKVFVFITESLNPKYWSLFNDSQKRRRKKKTLLVLLSKLDLQKRISEIKEKAIELANKYQNGNEGIVNLDNSEI